MIQASIISPHIIFHGTKEGCWCLSSHLLVAVLQSKVTRVPQAVSLFISKNFKKPHRRTNRASPDLESHHWCEPLLLAPNVGHRLRTFRQGWPWALFCILQNIYSIPPRLHGSVLQSSFHMQQFSVFTCNNATNNLCDLLNVLCCRSDSSSHSLLWPPELQDIGQILVLELSTGLKTSNSYFPVQP